jgi:transposase
VRRPSRKSVVRESEINIARRLEYLRKLNQLRGSNRFFFACLDESFVYEAELSSKVWADNSLRWATPPNRGRRLCFAHVFSETHEESVDHDNLLWMFCPEEPSSTDYHRTFQAKTFEEWFEKVLRSLSSGRYARRPWVIIMDNAPYHCRLGDGGNYAKLNKDDLITLILTKQAPTSAWTREELGHLTKAELQKRARPLVRLAVEELAEKYGHRVLFQPPGHPELNGSELHWAQAKGFVRRHLTCPSREESRRERGQSSIQMGRVKRLLSLALRTQIKSRRKIFDNVHRWEAWYWDKLQEEGLVGAEIPFWEAEEAEVDLEEDAVDQFAEGLDLDEGDLDPDADMRDLLFDGDC